MIGPMEYATTDNRQRAARAPLTGEMREALARLKAGARCEQCHGLAVLVRSGRLLCAQDGKIARLRRLRDRMRAPRI
jgi:hypothetical protein